MDDLTKFVNDFQKFDVNKILFEVWKKQKVKEFIIELNTKGQSTSQLYEKGINSKGVSLGDYADSTINGTSSFEGKISKGQRYDHITLSDSYDFYDSFYVNAFTDSFSIEADGRKENVNLLNEYKDIVGLTDENKNILIEFIKPFFIEEAKKFLQ